MGHAGSILLGIASTLTARAKNASPVPARETDVAAIGDSIIDIARRKEELLQDVSQSVTARL